MEKFLKEAAGVSGIHLTEEQIQRFIIFYEKLMETNRAMNLTAITEMREVVVKHFIDSMAVSKFYDLSNASIIDVGTGAGFPGIPLAILYPDAKFVLIDSLKKRLNFIHAILYLCEMKNVELVHGRAEDFGKDEKYRGKFDFCVSRAVAALPVLLELCIPFVKVRGKFISYKSSLINEELKKSENAMKVLSCELTEENKYELPFLDAYRVYAGFTKNEETDLMYPRPAGKIKQKPL